MTPSPSPARRRLSSFIWLLLLIEFADELVFGVREAAWPLIRDDLGLTYWQIGILLSLPSLFSSLVEPAIAILGDVWRRRVLVLGGGAVFTLMLWLIGVSNGFGLLLFAFTLFYPASGAFVSLSQAALMDEAPDRHEQNMARWTLAGSVGVVAGPLLLGAAIWIGSGWRGTLLALGVFSLVLTLVARKFPFPTPAPRAGGVSPWVSFEAGFRDALRAIRRFEVLRWLILLEFSDLLLDVFFGFLALYMVDVAGRTPPEAGLAVAVWSGLGLLGDLFLIPLLERVRGLVYLRYSVLVELVLFPLFLLLPGFWPRLAVLALLGFFNAGWYSILQGRLYTAMPGQSGTVVALGSISGILGGLLPLGLGLVAEWSGLQAAMWLLLLGPLGLFVGLPRRP